MHVVKNCYFYQTEHLHLGRYPLAGTPPGQVHPPGRYTPGQVHPPPPGRYTSWQVHPRQVHPPGRYTPFGRYTPGRYTPQAGTPPAGKPPGLVQPLAGTPPWQVHPPEQCMLGDTGNKRAVCVLLECILVKFCLQKPGIKERKMAMQFYNSKEFFKVD